MLDETILAGIRKVKPLFPGATFYVFGSRARGDARPDSDLDVYVVFREGKENFWDLYVQISKALHNELDYAFDILVSDERRFKDRDRLKWSIEHTVGTEGIVV